MKTTKNSSKKNQNPRASLGEYKGHSIVSVIRALGKAKFTAKEVAESLNRQGFRPNMHTVYLQTGAGRRNEGVIAELSKSDIAALKAGRKAARKVKKTTEKAPEVVAA
jgi:hypothetical protein